MPKSIRNRLMTTAMAMTPFLLGACGESDGTNNGPGQFEIFLVPALIYVASVAHARLRKRSSHRVAATTLA